MGAGDEIRVFFDAAKAQGATDEDVLRFLLGRGWPKEDVYRVLADRFEIRSGVEVPVYRRSGSAKDAFAYLLSFATLATWAIGLGSVLFTLINQWIEDPLSPDSSYTNSNYQIASALASVLIAFPIYLFTMRYIVQELEVHPEKLESGIRKWLSYIALLFAAATVVCDLITFLTFFLRGELTARFVLKVVTAFAIAGGVFWYYIGSLAKRTLEGNALFRRNQQAAGLATIAVAAAAILGLSALGGPGKQRLLQADARKVRSVSMLAQQIHLRWAGAGNKLPDNLDQLDSEKRQNPTTSREVAYHIKAGNAYELCTTFVLASPDQRATDYWAHPKGGYCFQLDAAQQAPFIPFDN